MSVPKTRIGILISGRGSNMEQLILGTNEQCEVVCVVSDKPDAPGLAIADKLGVATEVVDPGTTRARLSEDVEDRFIALLRSYQVDFVFLAGFMRILQTPFVNAFAQRIINIHPSLLPKYPGLNTHQRAITAGDQETGCSVHFVDDGLDTGKIIGRARVPISATDSEEQVAANVLAKEHQLYPEVMRQLASGTLSFASDTVLEL